MFSGVFLMCVNGVPIQQGAFQGSAQRVAQTEAYPADCNRRRSVQEEQEQSSFI